MASKQELETRLRAVQEIKSKYSVGTQEAYNAIKTMHRMRTFPEDVARIINQELSKTLGQIEITYPATGERVSGLTDILLCAYEYARGYFINPNEYNPEIYLIENFPGVIPSYEEFTSKDEPKNLAKVLLGFFAYANINSTNNSDIFGVDVENYIMSNYESIRDKIENPMIDNCDDFVEDMLRNFRNEAWGYESSLDARVKREITERDSFLENLLKKIPKKSLKN